MQQNAIHPCTAPLSRKVNGRETHANTYLKGMVPKKLLMNKSRELNRVNSCNDKGSSVTCHAYMCEK